MANGKPGRPTKYKPEYDELGKNYCLLGATDEELATFFEVAVSTIYEWKNNEPSFSEALKEGREIADAKVSQSLYHRALGYVGKDTKFATHEGEITDSKEFDKHYPPDPTACIFWLKNRQPQRWRDRIEHTGKNGTPLADPENKAELARQIVYLISEGLIEQDETRH